MLVEVVLTAIKLDREAGLVAIEVQDTATDRVLSAELEAAEAAVAEDAPKQRLGVGAIAAHLAGEVKELVGEARVVTRGVSCHLEKGLRLLGAFHGMTP
jgi:hypothetical protein